MAKVQLSQEKKEDLLDFINAELMAKGIKATTMDSIAASYKISKRSLYEIFDSKDKMIEEAIRYWHKKVSALFTDFFSSSANIMEAILKCFIFNREVLSRTCTDFFKDFHEFSIKKQVNSEKKRTLLNDSLRDMLQKGVEDGYFRKDINLTVQTQMVTIQMESLRKVEQLFPDGLTPVEIYDSIIITFLRGISTPKGIETLDNVLKELPQ